MKAYFASELNLSALDYESSAAGRRERHNPVRWIDIGNVPLCKGARGSRQFGVWGDPA